eukprot:m.256670 g.256670  ORF g.256670 m.256670 type:complete len:64 (+) comp40402_c1_seq5:1208-1399(+)
MITDVLELENVKEADCYVIVAKLTSRKWTLFKGVRHGRPQISILKSGLLVVQSVPQRIKCANY